MSLTTLLLDRLSLRRSAQITMATGTLGALALYAALGTAKAADSWNIIDILGEGGVALMSGIWALMILGSRPGGRVTLLLAGGLICIMLGSWVDCLDEFFRVAPHALWSHMLESTLPPIGMLTLTVGIHGWRQEQFSLNEHFEKRERLFRDHRVFDRITQLANADYLRRQIRLEHQRQPDKPCALVMLDVDRFHLVNREYGQREGDRLLQCISHLLLINLRNDDLLCRYAGDRFVILMPETTEVEARQMAEHLARIVALTRYHTREAGEQLRISVRIACARAHTELDTLLDSLNAAVDGHIPAGLQRA